MTLGSTKPIGPDVLAWITGAADVENLTAAAYEDKLIPRFDGDTVVCPASEATKRLVLARLATDAMLKREFEQVEAGDSYRALAAFVFLKEHAADSASNAIDSLVEAQTYVDAITAGFDPANYVGLAVANGWVIVAYTAEQAMKVGLQLAGSAPTKQGEDLTG